MKKFALCLLALSGLALGACAQQAVRLTKYEGRPIDRVVISHGFDVTLTQGRNTRAVVEISPELENNLIFTLEGTTLTISLREMPRGWNRKKPHLKADIVVSALNRLELSGSVDLQGQGTFTGKNVVLSSTGACDIDQLHLQVAGTFNGDFSGASETKNLSVSADGDVLLKVTGASELNSPTTLSTPKQVKVQLTGAAEADEVFVKAGNFSLNQSGASESKVQAKVTDLDVALSGGSECEMAGQTSSLRVNCVSASEYKGRGLSSKQATVTASGGADVELGVTGTAELTSSGASSIGYTGTPTIRRQESSGGSSIKKID